MYELRQDVTYEPFATQQTPQTLPWVEILAFAKGFVMAALFMILIVAAVPSVPYL
jgi:hypothetical protein